MDLDSLGGYPINIYSDPRATALDPDDSPPRTSSPIIPVKQEEPLAPPSPHANTAHPFIERSHTPAAEESAIEAPWPPAQPRSSSAAAPPPRHSRSRTTPTSTKACAKPVPRVMKKKKKAAKVCEA